MTYVYQLCLGYAKLISQMYTFQKEDDLDQMVSSARQQLSES